MRRMTNSDGTRLVYSHSGSETISAIGYLNGLGSFFTKSIETTRQLMSVKGDFGKPREAGLVECASFYSQYRSVSLTRQSPQGCWARPSCLRVVWNGGGTGALWGQHLKRRRTFQFPHGHVFAIISLTVMH